ncbi:leucyl aminopeptidase family protein [Actinosynnema sp. NPDC047251]|uniref:Probable cytosol aminopeptidase n=1 Tax=Saccharothrix espanaensis (strain ATCC 51144 / DSM 44229 / JCM 9112 / NBRC 15066 / NRRL 15764) TaxID=1179773 RepID=K0JR22_SACES|nr:leucyl aminopeptidase family protein [Saccharothrix espanaensis]CCH28201.1 Leucyl aminopeptidase [Saccharothrix espanaensis DSM 44229]
MRLPVPAPLVAVEAAGSLRRGAGRVVLAAPGEPPLLGPGGADVEASAEVSGAAGATHRQDGRWVLGIGDATPSDWRTAGASLARALDADADRDGALTFDVQLTPDADVRSFVLGLALGGYRFKVTGEPAPKRVKSLRLVGPDVSADEVRHAVDLARATSLARDLANAPSNVKDPDWLAATAVKAAAGVPGLDVVVRDEKWLAREGFGGVLAVGGGSARPPRLIHMTWNGPADAPHLVLVGKGITFDTGGISVKPADGMHLMRTDMAGGGAVIGALIAIARLGLPVRVTGLVPCAENHVSGSAYRPGDVVRHYGGTTTEVTNTDAEGRMVLADALAYAVHQLQPDALVDVATLTGAMKVTLGTRIGGLFASDDEIAARVAAAGERTGEAWWRMPLLEELADAVKSDIADVRQIPPGPGAITAALFLREFTAGLPWAHLDIAGPARADKNYAEVVAGASGFAARTLVEFAAHYRD